MKRTKLGNPPPPALSWSATYLPCPFSVSTMGREFKIFWLHGPGSSTWLNRQLRIFPLGQSKFRSPTLADGPLLIYIGFGSAPSPFFSPAVYLPCFKHSAQCFWVLFTASVPKRLKLEKSQQCNSFGAMLTALFDPTKCWSTYRFSLFVLRSTTHLCLEWGWTERGERGQVWFWKQLKSHVYLVEQKKKDVNVDCFQS